MAAKTPHGPVLVVAEETGCLALCSVLARPELKRWKTLEARDVEHARFLVQHDGCELLLIDQDAGKQNVQALIRLASRHGMPVVLAVSGTEPEAQAGSSGASLHLPRDLLLGCPFLLNEALRAALRDRVLWRRARRIDAELRDCRRQVRSLLALLWESAARRPFRSLVQSANHARTP